MTTIQNDPELIRSWYDKVAAEYALRNFDELSNKPFDRDILRRFATLIKGAGRVYDLGCGPGEVASFLHQCGCDVAGIDLSAEMVKEARRLSPQLSFEQGDMFALDVPGGSWMGIVAFYAFVHNTPEQLDALFKEWQRVLAPGGSLLMAFHVGSEVIQVREFMGETFTMDFVFFDTDDVVRRIKTAGLVVDEVIIRYPYPKVEYASKRAYILARKA
ncbi:MAG TPA: class I SAM-dependent methyltransferase [Bacillota bacterium]|nr:class I SAM-dependent methyltransferase [Bacillota bacterium]